MMKNKAAKIEELLKSGLVNISEIARKLYPKNKYPEGYLLKKVNRTEGRRLTEKDLEEIKNMFKQYL